ncbi:sigma factor [Niallia sp. 03190]|uniref:sigma factor n=1 Tax=Niallia sp. 03190 TaxID=3458061 RepID=UPI004044C0E7
MEEQNEYNQLITRILSGSEQAYAELYDKMIQSVYKNVHFLIDEKTSDFIEYVNEKQVQ